MIMHVDAPLSISIGKLSGFAAQSPLVCKSSYGGENIPPLFGHCFLEHSVSEKNRSERNRRRSANLHSFAANQWNRNTFPVKPDSPELNGFNFVTQSAYYVIDYYPELLRLQPSNLPRKLSWHFQS
jgi:hypothetical protein